MILKLMIEYKSMSANYQNAIMIDHLCAFAVEERR